MTRKDSFPDALVVGAIAEFTLGDDVDIQPVLPHLERQPERGPGRLPGEQERSLTNAYVAGGTAAIYKLGL
ncbi:MAG: hypothetical protein U0514_03455 [Candidatus Andersenbacteria bacterium]